MSVIVPYNKWQVEFNVEKCNVMHLVITDHIGVVIHSTLKPAAHLSV